jgi:hypothetical protein
VGDLYEEFDLAIAEVEHLRRLISPLKVKQIRSSELRDVLKATALTWFRVRRLQIEQVTASAELKQIDDVFRIILDACAHDSAKTTYTKAITQAKSSLISLRATVLILPRPTRSTDALPNFSSLASDARMRTILERRWEECGRCLLANAPLAGTVMMGGLLEALFVARANRLTDKTPLFKCSTTPVDGKTKKPLDLRQWTLAPYIDVGHELGWISRSAKDVAAILRDYRNYIHPEKERAHGIILSSDDAVLLWEVTKNLSRELLALKGVV